MRLFTAHVINVSIIAGILGIGERKFLLMLLPSFYAIVFLGVALNRAISDPNLSEEKLPGVGIAIYTAVICALATIFLIK